MHTSRGIAVLLTGSTIALLGAQAGPADATPVASLRPVLLPSLGGGSASTAAINNQGDIAGSSRDASGAWHAVLWRNGKIQDLGTLGGRSSQGEGIDDAGRVVGTSQVADGGSHAFVWEHGVMRDLGVRGDVFSLARAASNGSIVGTFHVEDTFSGRRAFVMRDGRATELKVEPGSSAEDVNAAGEIAGTSRWRDPGDPEFDGYQAFVWKDGSAHALGTLGGAGSTSNGISDRGHVVGTSDTATGEPASFFWDGTPMRRLASPAGTAPSAKSVNGADVIVGTDGRNGRALIWAGPDATAAELAMPADAITSAAADINESGIVVGSVSYLSPTFHSRAVVWR